MRGLCNTQPRCPSSLPGITLPSSNPPGFSPVKIDTMPQAQSPLVIVDSVAIADRLRQVLGSDFEVCATGGQICDLPADEMGIDSDTAAPRFHLTETGRRALRRIRPLVPAGKTVYLATESSSAGECLAIHLVSRLRLKHYRRIHLVSLEPAKLRATLGCSTPLNYCLAKSYQARRAIDRLIGFTVSRPLAAKLGRKGVSTGRLQAAILGLLLARERAHSERRSAVATIDLHFPDFVASCRTVGRIEDPSREIQRVSGGSFRVVRSVSRVIARMPPPPLTISSTLVLACRLWAYRPEEILAGLDALYLAGQITQPSTYICSFNSDALASILAVARRLDLPLPEAGHTFPEPQVAEAGIEGLRPTNAEIEDAGKTEVEQRLYSLIWARAVLSQLAPAAYSMQELTLADADGRRYWARACQLQSPGFLASIDTLGVVEADDAPPHFGESPPLPDYPKGAYVTPDRVRAVASDRGLPPGLYSAADLAAELEELDVGRADAAYNVMRLMSARGHIEEVRGTVTPTDQGRAIYGRLCGSFSFAAVPYLRMLEAAVQGVAQGRRQLCNVIEDFRSTLLSELETFEAGPATPLGKTREQRPCPKCGRRMDLTNGPHGAFWACIGFTSQPPCDYTSSN